MTVIGHSYSPKGRTDADKVRLLVCNGVTPDVIVRLRPRDFASGRDRVLERAIKALENGEAKPLLVAGGETDG